MATTAPDESRSMLRGLPASAPHDFANYPHLTYNRHPVYLKIHWKSDDKPSMPDLCRTSSNKDIAAFSTALTINVDMVTELVRTRSNMTRAF
jgi:hypothetical protein